MKCRVTRMYIIRDACPTDIDELYRLASYLNTVNLPAERAALEKILSESNASFGQELAPLAREYLFVMEEKKTCSLLGTSMILAQHGTPSAPHIYFEVLRDEKYSDTLKRHFVHQVLKIGYSYNGPTEIGGIVLHPSYRGSPEKLGKQLSFVRFLYIGKHPTRFRRRVLAELLPPLESDGTSLLWEALGRRFTGLSYQEADFISKHNKEFIRNLFPTEGIYATLLPEAASALIGKVGPATKGVARMLEDIGFTYQNRIDPFDGGPHFSARVEHISLLRNLRELSFVEGAEAGELCLVAIEKETAPAGERFACVQTNCMVEDGVATLSTEVVQALRLAKEDRVWVLSLKNRTPQPQMHHDDER
jgi:arginine N-succinyltransferase